MPEGIYQWKCIYPRYCEDKCSKDHKDYIHTSELKFLDEKCAADRLQNPWCL